MIHYTLVSDLHVDANGEQPADFDTEWVIVAGDTSNSVEQSVNVLNKYVRKGHRVFAVDGNHEHYANLAAGRSVRSASDQFYQTGTFDFGFAKMSQEIVLIGTNGWYPVVDENHWTRYMLDGHRINAPGEYLNYLAKLEARYVMDALQLLKPWQRAIIVTHTAPCRESLDPKYEGSDGNPYFFNPQMDTALTIHKEKILKWHHGHTHQAMDVTHRSVNIVTNPRGYPRENPDWKPLVIELSI